MTRTRRDHMKFLTLIRRSRCFISISGEIKTVSTGQKLEYIEATEDDVSWPRS